MVYLFYYLAVLSGVIIEYINDRSGEMDAKISYKLGKKMVLKFGKPFIYYDANSVITDICKVF